MVPQISPPGVTYDAASGSWETNCIQGDGCSQTFLQRLPEVNSYPFGLCYAHSWLDFRFALKFKEIV